MRIEFSGDELILALVSLIRAATPAMLRQGPDGFTVDFEPVEKKPVLSADEKLMLKFREVLEGPASESASGVELDSAESRRLVVALERLESLQAWPADVLEMSRNLRARLAPAQPG